jgi:putative transposase
LPSRGYSTEFREKVLELLDAGRTVREVAGDLGISRQTVYVWRKQELIDRGELPGVTSADQGELLLARRRIQNLERELAIRRRAADLLWESIPTSRRFEAISVLACEGLPIQTACRVLGVSEAGYFAWRSRRRHPEPSGWGAEYG